MRIIGGNLKGKAILPPINYTARPTTDFAKEGLFNILINEYNLEDISLLDLFSGTGSISLEFASRGCKDIVSIEMNPMHAKFIKQVASVYKVKGMQVVRHNVFDFIEICNRKFDIVFADPPYNIEGLDTIPDKIYGKEIIAPGGYLILEHPGNYNFEKHIYFVKEKKYGNVHFSFFRKEL
ncbi:MAG: RsmD family RNA methyltransferase [Bacteroidales bacterium]